MAKPTRPARPPSAPPPLKTQRPVLPSPLKFTQFPRFQFLLWLCLAVPILLLEGFQHWQTGVFFVAALALSLVVRELMWGNRDLLQDELVVRDDHESIWLFVFGRMVRNTEEHAAERRRLLEITGTGRKFLIRIAVIALGIVYFAWMKNREAIHFRPSAFLYIVIFTILISSVFACQFWAALVVAAVVTVFATKAEWGLFPVVFAGFLILFFAALSSYRQTAIEWVYAHERDFKKWTRGPSVVSSIILVSLLAVVSLWLFDKILPDSFKAEKQSRAARAMESIKNQVQEKIAQKVVEQQLGRESTQGPPQGEPSAVAPIPALGPGPSQGAQTIETLTGTDPQVAKNLASRLNPEELKALERLAAASSRYQQAIGSSGSSARGGSGSGGGSGELGSRPGLDPEAWERFLEQIRQNPDSQKALLQKYPDMKSDLERMATGHAPRAELAAKLEDEFLRQHGPLASQPLSDQKQFAQLAKKLELSDEQLKRAMSGQKLSENELKSLASEVAATQPLFDQAGDSAVAANESGAGAAGQGRSGEESSSASGRPRPGGGPGPDQGAASPPGVAERLKAAPLTRAQRQEKVRVQVEQTFKFLENAGLALLYLGGIYLIFILFSKFSEKTREETKPAGKLNRDEKKALLSELKAIHARPLSAAEEVVKCYHLFLKMMELVQCPRSRELTPVHFAGDVVQRFPHLKKPVPFLSEVFCQVFYGKLEVNSETLQEFRGQFRLTFRQFGLKVP
ncbi:MAG: hypothetical protein IT288_15350 [Bdellovibrionales bacterium]|nr:hypothetical protein [Bdellovibrionales bacterium]